MNNIKISVIVPVYNAEHTIERCVDSIVSSYVPYEIICVDDGSKDGSWQLLQKLATQNDKIKAIHQTNAGAGKARANGISNAKGEFIMFCDADDAYLPDTIDNIEEDLEAYNPDYIVFHRMALNQQGKENTWGEGNEVTKLETNWQGYLNNYMLQRSHGMGVVTKVFRKSILNKYNIKFGDFLFGEDMWFNLTYLMHCSSFVEDYRTYYQQYVTDGSICQKSYSDFYDKNIQCIDSFVSCYSSQAKLITDFIYRFKFCMFTWSLQRVWMGIDAKNIIEKFKACKLLTNREDIQVILKYCLSSNILTDTQREEAICLLKGNIFLHAWHNYYLNKIKIKILKIIK